MQMKKLLAAGAAAALMISAMAVPVYAHGGHGGGGHGGHGGQGNCASYSTGTAVAACPVEDCTLTGRHDHDGVTYCGYAHRGEYHCQY